jgi:hypothetical protein
VKGPIDKFSETSAKQQHIKNRIKTGTALIDLAPDPAESHTAYIG